MGTVGFLRNFQMAKNLSNIFDDSYVLTIKNISIPLNTKINTDFTRIYRVFNFDYRNAARLLSKKKDLRKISNTQNNSRKKHILKKLFDSFPTNLLLGEGGIIYIINAIIKGLFLIKKHKITHIYSSYRPVADHFIAYHLKLFFPKLNWTMDFRDPPIDANRDNVYLEKLQWWFLKKLCTKADNIITVSEGVSNSLRKTNLDITTLKNGIYKLFDDLDKKKYHKFTLSFTGSIYPELHKPGILLQAIKNLADKNLIIKDAFQLIYAGKDSAIWNNLIDKYNLKDFSVDMQQVSLKKAVEIQHKSHVNILFSWAGKNIQGLLSGKLFEYLATGNPIIAIINGKKDNEFEQIFSELNAGYIFYSDDDIIKIENKVLELYMQWLKTGKIRHYYNPTALEKYSWKNRMEKLMKMMKIS